MKKIVSIIIAMTLILSLCPLTFAVDASGKHNYVFTGEALGQTAKKEPSPTTYTYNNIVSTVSDKWLPAARYYPKLTFLNPQATIETYGGLVYPFGEEHVKTETGAKPSDGYQKVCVGVKINVEKGGNYLPKLTYFASESAPIVDVYLIKADTKSNDMTASEAFDKDVDPVIYTYLQSLNGQYKISQIDMWAAEKEAVSYDFKDAVQTLEVGDYYLYFNAVGYNEKFASCTYNNGGRSYSNVGVIGLNSFSLTPVQEDEELTNAFTAKEESHNPATKNVYGYKSTDTANTIVKYEPVTTDKVIVSTTDTKDFLYWAQGLTDEKKILSFEPSFEYTPAEGNNYLVAVYRDSVKKLSFSMQTVSAKLFLRRTAQLRSFRKGLATSLQLRGLTLTEKR